MCTCVIKIDSSAGELSSSLACVMVCGGDSVVGRWCEVGDSVEGM